MRAHSGDFGPPSGEVIRDFAEHSENCQRAASLQVKAPRQAIDALIEWSRLTSTGKAFLDRMKELEAIAASVQEDPTIKYFDEQLGTKGEHLSCETVDNIVFKLNHQQERLKEAEWLLEQVDLAEDVANSPDWQKRFAAFMDGGVK